MSAFILVYSIILREVRPMKKLLILLLALMMAAQLAACGESQTEETSGEIQESVPGGTAEEETETPEEDLIAIESIEFIVAGPKSVQGATAMDMKVRNLTDEPQTISLRFQVLDKNGDILEETGPSLPEDLGPGQAVTAHTGVFCDYEEIGALTIRSYSFVTDGAYESYDFIKPLTFVEGEKIVQGEEVSYSWVPEELAQENSAVSHGENSAGEGNSLLGTWEATSVSTSEGNYVVSELEDSKMYSWSDWKFIVTETGNLYLQTNNTSAKSDAAVVTDTDITAGGNHWVLDGNRLSLTTNDTTVYYEKTSDDQSFPELEKKALVDMLEGTWSIDSTSRTGSFTFSGKSATAIINGVSFSADTLCVLMKESRIVISGVQSDMQISMDLYYTYDNGVLSLTYSGDPLTKQ